MTVTDIPVYLFTGFLESGKTRFIQETLEDKRFNNGEKTLLLVCEEGEEEFEPDRFYSPNVYMETIESEDEFSPEYLESLRKKHKARRVIVEYNGMWLLKSFFDKLPKNWVIAQEFMFADARTFLNYNTNMRQLCVDKMNTCELVVFNRFPEGMDFMELHKIVRGTSRRTDIAYEKESGDVFYDDVEDPLPFDINAPIVKIGDNDYAIWYRDMTEKLEEYDGKTVRFKCLVNKTKVKEDSFFVCGRNVMTCCIDDIQFAGLVCKWPKAASLQHKSWINVTAKMKIEYHKVYGRPGPVLTATTISPASAPEQEVATFF